MDEVFTLTKRNPDSRIEEFIYSSQNIYDIIDKMFSVGYAGIDDFKIYVTDYGRNSVLWKEWRSKE